MKIKNLFALVIVGGLLFATSCKNESKPTGKVVEIKDCRTTEEPKEDPLQHKHDDVVINRVNLFGENNYKITYYQTENEVLNFHSAYLGAMNDYDKAEINRVNDTLLKVRLFSSSNSEIQDYYKVWGFGAMSAMSTDNPEAK